MNTVNARPGLPSLHWTLTDNLNGSPGVGALALDGDPRSFWSTQRPMRPGDAVTLDMGASQKIARIVLDDRLAPSEFPRGYLAEASEDGRRWLTLAEVSSEDAAAAVKEGVLQIRFPPTKARYLRITNRSAAPGVAWSIHELMVYGPPRYTAEVHVGIGGWRRMIRLTDGRWLSVGTLYPSSATHFLQLRVSNDNARTWKVLSEVEEPGRRMDNGELIQLPTGVVLLSGRSVIQDRSFHLPVYRSNDNGEHWSFLSMLDSNDRVVAQNQPSQGLWEPKFFLLPDRRVSVVYANEKHSVAVPPYSQVCSQRISNDGGATWGPERTLVAQSGGGSLRPGMPVVTRMKDGRYVEVSEVVGIDNAAVYAKFSRDGVHWSGGLGDRIPLQHAGPWVASLSNGRLLVTSCSNEISYSDDLGRTWRHETTPPWDLGFTFSFPAIYQTGPDEIAVMNTHRGVFIRFLRASSVGG